MQFTSTQVSRNYQQLQNTGKQKGVALIVVMLIVALITVMAVEMSSRLQLNVARTLNLKANNQAYWYALGAEQFAQGSLATLNSLTGDNINLSQPWAEAFEYPVEGGFIKAKLTDMQACFNLNAINSTYTANNNQETNDNTQNTDLNKNDIGSKTATQKQNNDANTPSASQQAFHKLLETYIADSLLTDTIRDSLIDWVDEDSRPKNYGAEDSDYESLVSPYLAANSLLTHPSEIRLVNGIDEAMSLGDISIIQKVVCVLPETALRINVNTITEENAVVLSSLLGENLDLGIDIINSRPEEGFSNRKEFLALPEVSSLDLSAEKKQWFDVTTKYFKLETSATFQSSQFRLSTIFRLDDGGVAVVSREFGGAF